MAKIKITQISVCITTNPDIDQPLFKREISFVVDKTIEATELEALRREVVDSVCKIDFNYEEVKS